MMIQQIVTAGAAALATVLLIAELGARAVAWVRKRSYERQGLVDKQYIAGVRESFPQADAAAVQRFKDARKGFQPYHQESINEQNRYYGYLIRSVAGLWTAFVITAVTLVAFPHSHWGHLYGAFADLVALGYVLYFYLRSRRTNQRWILARIRSELHRQAGILEAARATPAGSVKRRDLRASKIAAAVEPEQPVSKVPTRLRAYWDELEANLTGGALPDQKSFIAYLHARPLRQSGWFRSSIDRLKRDAEFRSRILRYLYFACCGFVMLKVVALTDLVPALQAALPTLTILFLFCISVTTAWTAFYLSSNRRSLLHRYVRHSHDIEMWLTRSSDLIAGGGFDATRALDSIITFEALMAEELVDWVCISSHDTFEISAA